MVRNIRSVCNLCGKTQNSDVYVENVVGFTVEQDGGPCSCGGQFSIPDAVYYADGRGEMTAIARSPQGAAHLRLLGGRIETMLQQGATAEAVRETVEQMPLGARLLRSLEPKSINDWVTILGLITYVVMWTTGHAPSPPEAVRTVFPSPTVGEDQPNNPSSVEPSQNGANPQDQDDRP